MRYALSLAAVCALAAGASGANLLADPGFDSFHKDAFQRWQIPSGWPGKLIVVSAKGQPRTGGACAQLTAAEEKGAWKGRMLSAAAVPVIQGARYRFSVWAKGQGQLVLGCVEYGESEGKKTYTYAGKDQAAPLTAEWKEVVFVYFQEDPSATRFVPYIEVRGKDGQAMVDDGVFEAEAAPGYAMSVAARHTMAAQGSEAAYDLTAKTPKEAGAAKVLVTGKTPDGKSVQGDVPVGPDGKAVFALPLAKDAALGIYELRFVLEKGGVAETVWVDVVDPATYAAFAKAAAGIKIAAPARLVFVGDSLTAQQRGYNYVDKVAGWIRQKYGDKVEVFNAGVGGDFLTRVRDRLDKDVIALKPTRVFIFLGHNDSKVSSTSEYKKPVTPFDQVEPLFTEMIRKMQQAGAQVTVMSSSSSNYAVSGARAAESAKAGKAHNLFGRPDALEQFNEGARKAAEATESDYLDVYGPTRDHPAKPSLYSPSDGVHLTQEGNRFIALQVLLYLGR